MVTQISLVITFLLITKHCVLEDLHQETRAQNEQLENEMDKLHSKFACSELFVFMMSLGWLHLTFFLSSSNEDIIQELREEIKALQSYLDSANEEIQVLVLVNRI